MQIYRIIVLISAFLISSVAHAASEDTMKNTVLKIKAYDRETIGGNYYFSHWGSAVVLEWNKIITNAHVVMDTNGEKPTGLYEVCKSVPTHKDPLCFSTAKLISYDTVADLAVLELATSAGKDFIKYSNQSLSIGSSVIAYGYPAIGGSNITRTEGKIWGTEGENYKFDGTIDHGNSGGGAFDKDGKLVGIPYAVSSDNGVIGYIIPVNTVKEFLAGKTYDIQKHKTAPEQAFLTYIKNIQKLFQNKNVVKTKYVSISDITNAGFQLKGATESKDGTIFDYRFIDKLERVAIMIACSRDSSGLKTSLELAEMSLSEKGKSHLMNYTGGYLDSKKTMYISTIIPKDPTNGQTMVASTIFYKDAPMCASYIISNDGLKKDKALYAKALALVKKVKFTNQKALSKKVTSSFFQIASLPTNVYVSEGSSIDTTSILPQIYFQFGSGEYSTLSALDVYTFKKRDDYMNIGYSTRNYYKGSTFTFESFFDRYKTVADPTISDKIITSKNGKKMILTSVDDSSEEIPRSKVYIFYPFKTATGEYKAYQAIFEYETRNVNYVQEIEDFFRLLELPGASPF
jgi:hypothetical protein